MLKNSFMRKTRMISADEALPGRDEPLSTSLFHAVNQHKLKGPFPSEFKKIIFAMGCFWGAERLFWQLPGVHVTAVGYAGGFTPNPTYEEVCSGLTGHTEAVLVVYDPKQISLKQLLIVFFEEHDPTQGMRQGNDIGTNYRSAIYVDSPEDFMTAQNMCEAYQQVLSTYGFSEVLTQIAQNVPFYYAEDYHQQYLHKHPDGYCGVKGTGVLCPR